MSSLAFLLVMISAFLHVSWNAVIHKVSGHTSVIWLGLCIGAVCSIIASLVIPFDRQFNTEGLIYFALTGIVHFIYFIFLIQAYRLTDFSSAYPIARGLGVLGASIFGIVLFNENINFLKLLGILLILFGILIIGLKKGISLFKNLKEISYSVLVGIMIISYSLIDKKGVQYISPILYSTGVFFLPALFLTPFIIKKHRSDIVKCLKEYKIASCTIGLGSFGTYLIILFALQLSHVSYMVPVRETSVAIGVLYGFIFFKEKPTNRKIIAVLAITAGLVLIRISFLEIF